MENATQNNFGEQAGEQIYVTAAHPTGLTLKQYHALTERQRREHTWRPMVRGWLSTFACESTPERQKNRAGD